MSDMDRFVQFIRRVAADYHFPPSPPRDDMWVRIESAVHGAVSPGGRVSDGAPDVDMERFVEFLREVAAEYHEPPPTPRDAMWDGIEADLAGDAGEAKVDDVLSSAAFLYRTPPPPPREEMWGRIEAAWQMRRSAGSDAREAGLEPLPARPLPDLADDLEASAPGRTARKARGRRTGLVLTGLAVAASLVIGIAIGRRSIEQLRSDSNPTTIARGVGGTEGERGGVAPGATDPVDALTGDVSAMEQDPAIEGALPAAGRTETLETARPAGARLAAAGEPRAPDAIRDDRRTGSADGPARRERALRYATTEHLGRAEALLTTFRTDPDAGNGQVSRWARELLAETRLLMDSSSERDPRMNELLQELELTLALISALGDDASSDERAVVADGLDRQGTLPRLRAVIPPGPAGAGRVGT